MTRYDIVFSVSANKELSKLDRLIAKRIVLKIDNLSRTPFPSGVKKLQGEDLFRIRVGDYRVVYSINSSEKKIVIYRIRHRKDVYKK